MSYKPYSSIKSSGIELRYLNSSGTTLTKGTPVRITTAGNLDFIDVSIESNVFALGGVVSEDAANNTQTKVITTGTVENITTTASLGDPIFLSKTGGLTNVKPSLGVDGFVAGDYVVRIGTVAKNATFPLLKDLILDIKLIGQLES